MATLEQIEKIQKIESELKRLGVDFYSLGPVDSICCGPTNSDWSQVVVYDGNGEWRGNPDEAISVLGTLADDSSFEDVWQAIDSIDKPEIVGL